MKMKKIAPIVALALATSLLSGCSTAQKTSFYHYWNYNVQVMEPIHEELEYAVTFEKGSNYGYELAYEGTYKTALQSKTTPDGYIYVYKTELNVDVTYTLGEESTTLTDYVTTEVEFYPMENGLKPISSKKSVKSSSPATANVTKLESCYKLYEYDVATTYEGKGGKVILRQKDNTTGEYQTTEQNFTIDNENLSYLDNEQLLLSLRAMPASLSSARLLAYSPFTASVQKVAVGVGESTESEFEFTKNGELVKQTIPYRTVQMQLDEKNPGFAQTAWIAKTTSTNANTNRNVMLRLQTPLYQGLGTLIYTLTSANYS